MEYDYIFLLQDPCSLGDKSRKKSMGPRHQLSKKILGCVIVCFTLLVPCSSWAVEPTVACGSDHSLALKDDGTVWAWGYNNYGQLGNGSTSNNFTPVQVNSLIDVVAICGGSYHSLALKEDGTVWAWGYGGVGQLGNGSTSNSSTPVQVSNLIDVVAISCGAYHSLALKEDGTFWAWGYNDYGQLGNGSKSNSSTPIHISSLMVASISGGGNHSLALKEDGTAWAWGYNNYGQLGNGSKSNSSTPVQVNSLTDVVAINGGGSRSLALKEDGTVWAWGYGGSGQLGNGSTSDSSTPVQVSSLTDIVAIHCSGYFSLALKEDGTVWAWGNGDYGRLGNGSTSNQSTPVQVSSLTDVVAINGGGRNSLALKKDGTVWAWGEGQHGNLGNGSTSNSSTPVQVSDLNLGSSVDLQTPDNEGDLDLKKIADYTSDYSALTKIWHKQSAMAFSERTEFLKGVMNATPTVAQTATYTNSALRWSYASIKALAGDAAIDFAVESTCHLLKMQMLTYIPDQETVDIIAETLCVIPEIAVALATPDPLAKLANMTSLVAKTLFNDVFVMYEQLSYYSVIFRLNEGIIAQNYLDLYYKCEGDDIEIRSKLGLSRGASIEKVYYAIGEKVMADGKYSPDFVTELIVNNHSLVEELYNSTH
ncbi:MAG: hypothetical protein HQL55_12310 [Magnetococcales bacterium]|nr:hypothetical protein [Magnetococcales bacterium]